MADEATELTGKYLSRRSKGKCRFKKSVSLGPEIFRWVNEWDRSNDVPSSDDSAGMLVLSVIFYQIRRKTPKSQKSRTIMSKWAAHSCSGLCFVVFIVFLMPFARFLAKVLWFFCFVWFS